MSRSRSRIAAAVIALSISAGTASATQLPSWFQDQLVMGNLNFPVAMAFLPDGRLVVAERQGTLRLLVEGKMGAYDPFGVVDSVRADGPATGLHGVAVDQGWPTRPYVYTWHQAADSTLRLTRYRADGDLDEPTSVFLTLDAGSRYDVLRGLPDATGVHACGALRFGPDGMLYASVGDGGDPCAVRDTASLLGVVLRLDVSGLPDGPGGPPDRAVLAPADNPFAAHPDADARLVWTRGLRNPYRLHVDPVDGALFVADIGDDQFEEIDRVAGPAVDLGWPMWEGVADGYPVCPSDPGAVYTAPVYAYAERVGGHAAVIGAGVYRGSACASCNFPANYEGNYFLADYYQGFVRRLIEVEGTWQVAPPVTGQPSASDWGTGFEGVSEFLVGADGALWYCRNGDVGGNGEVHRIVYVEQSLTGVGPETVPAVDFRAPYPMPARAGTRFAFTLAATAAVELDLFDVGGRRVLRLISSPALPPGAHEVDWDGRLEDGTRATPGVYLARLAAGGTALMRRVAVVP